MEHKESKLYTVPEKNIIKIQEQESVEEAKSCLTRHYPKNYLRNDEQTTSGMVESVM